MNSHHPGSLPACSISVQTSLKFGLVSCLGECLANCQPEFLFQRSSYNTGNNLVESVRYPYPLCFLKKRKLFLRLTQ